MRLPDVEVAVDLRGGAHLRERAPEADVPEQRLHQLAEDVSVRDPGRGRIDTCQGGCDEAVSPEAVRENGGVQ